MLRFFKNLLSQDRGFALPTVTLFILVIGISGAAFFTIASRETTQARYRQSSSEAFMLADGALERVRAKLLEDRAWREGWSDIALANGSYALSIHDTTFDGHDEAIQILVSGMVENAQRNVEVMALVPPAAFWFGLFVYGDARALGNLCLDGTVFVGGDADFGNGDVRLACGGVLEEGFDLTPPLVFTEGNWYPDATYYDVRATEIGGTYQARILDRLGFDITSALGDSLENIISYNNGAEIFTYDFDNPSLLDFYFNDATGIFSRDSGDIAVVVNFGSIPLINPPGDAGVSDLVFDGDGGSIVHATVINSRFIGVNDEDRVDESYWRGGTMMVKQIVFEPYHGLAAIAGDFQDQAVGGANAQMGTEDYPALVYVTRDVVSVGANFRCVGEIICLGDWRNVGGPDIIFNDGFLAHLPDYFTGAWQQGVSGATQILRWREVASVN